MSAVITAAMLLAKGACADQVLKFTRLFGESVVVTPELCVKHASAFDWDWAARNMLTAPARATYDAARASARATYDAARASAWADAFLSQDATS